MKLKPLTDSMIIEMTGRSCPFEYIGWGFYYKGVLQAIGGVKEIDGKPHVFTDIGELPDKIIIKASIAGMNMISQIFDKVYIAVDELQPYHSYFGLEPDGKLYSCQFKQNKVH